MKIICMLFGHRYVYYMSQDVPSRQFRSCRYCGEMQEYRTLPGLGRGWYTLVQRTQNGAVLWAAENSIKI